MSRSKPITFLATAAAIPLAALAVTGCGGGSDNNATGATPPPKTANGRSATIGVENNGNLGKILANSKGDTVYLFKRDRGTKSACTGACASAWPPVRTSSKPVVGSGLNASLVATTARSDGKPQVTYNGHPLYTYTGDNNPGDANGQGLTAFGGGWFAVTPAGNQASGQASSSGGGGLGY
jgi:predicted lipoprotein with Yx(FWY)xxD motif